MASSSSSSFSSSSSVPSLRFSNFLHSIPDDTVSTLALLLCQHGGNNELEIEGKLGKMVLQRSNNEQRVSIEGVKEMQLMLDGDKSQHRFIAEVPQAVFDYLDDRVLKPRSVSEQENARIENRHPMMKVSRSSTTDYFYESPSGSSPIRHTVNESDNKETTCVKTKLCHIDFLSPWLHSAVVPIDFRVSLSSEVSVPSPNKDLRPYMIRRKARRSYSQDMCRVDCTTVETYRVIRQIDGKWAGDNSSKVTSKEIEVEVRSAAIEALRAEIQRIKESLPHSQSQSHSHAGIKPTPLIIQIADNLLDNLKTLARIAVTPLPQQTQPVHHLATTTTAAEATQLPPRKRARETEDKLQNAVTENGDNG